MAIGDKPVPLPSVVPANAGTHTPRIIFWAGGERPCFRN